jgi:small GTP-binding protein
MSIFDQSQETILEWFKEYSKKKQQEKILSLGIDLGTSYSSLFSQYLEQSEKKHHTFISYNWDDTMRKMAENIMKGLERDNPFLPIDVFDPWDYRLKPDFLEPRYGFDPFDFGKYYYPAQYPDRFAPMTAEEKGPVRWVCGRYTPAGCFDNEYWDPKTYRPAYEARKPIYVGEVPVPEEEPTKPLNELKVVFLGDGGAGKSHTIARLLKNGAQTKDFPDISTPGIVIQDKTYPIGGQDVKVHYWDFGGQEILHSMHRMFLTERTLYVVMLNVRDDTQDDRARYWLYNLRSFAKGAPVLLVLNQMDMNENATLNESDLRKLYPALAPEVAKLSTLKYSDREFEEKFIDVLRKQISSMEILAFPFVPAWSRLKEKLQNMTENYIHGDIFRQFCEECGVTKSDNIRRDLLNWFSDLGISFCYSGSAKLEDYVVLRPDWITNAIYIILFNKAEAANNGRVSHDILYRMLSSTDTLKFRRTVDSAVYTYEEMDYVLKVFRKFRLSFLVDDEVEFLPMLCNANANPISLDYENDPDALEFRMHYEYLPSNVIHRLMVDRRRELDLQTVWLYGGQFHNGCTGLSAVVKTEGNLLRVMVRRENSQCQPQLYLNDLKTDIERINAEMGLTVENTEVVYKSTGKTACFDYEDLLFAQEMGDTHISCKELRKKIPIADILKQSGHSADKAQVDLLTDIVRYCEMLQDDNTTWDKSEDERTTYIRNLLRAKGYIANDQSRGGISGGDGKQAGELDLDIRLDPAERLSIFEALNLEGSAESYQDYWNRHLDKLLDNYNSTGCPFLFHVTYLSCAKSTFTKHCVTFEDHLRYYHPVGFSLTSERPTDPLTKRGIRHGGFLRAMETVYDCGGIPMTVYHFFIRIGE